MMRAVLGATAMAAMALSSGLAAAEGETVAVLTPYLSSVATHEMVTTFQDAAKAKGWSVNVVDTNGDFGALASRLEDVVHAGVDAIVVVSIDPAQVQDQISAAAAANIPVFAMDGKKVDGVVLNVTSDNFQLGKTLTDFLLGQIGGSGNIVKFFHSDHPGVHQRELALDEGLQQNPGVKVIADHYVQVPGPIDDARKAMETILQAHPDDIDAVWAAWDEPAIGALLAMQDMAPNAKFVIAGIDGNPQAIEMIQQCTPLIGTVRQDFAGMATTTVDQMAAVFAGNNEVDRPAEIFQPGVLVTRDTLGVHCD